MEEKKYKLTDETIEIEGKGVEYITLYRIEALRDFGDVKAGDKGGFVQSEKNLSQEGDCWIYGDAKVIENAIVSDNAKVADDLNKSLDTIVDGNAKVYDNAIVHGLVHDNAKVYGNAYVGSSVFVHTNAQIYGNAKVYKWAYVTGNAQIYGNAILERSIGDTIVGGSAQIYGNAVVTDNAEVWGSAEVFGEARVYGSAEVFGEARVHGNVHIYGKTKVNEDVSDNARIYKGIYINDKMLADLENNNIICVDGLINNKNKSYKGFLRLRNGKFKDISVKKFEEMKRKKQEQSKQQDTLKAPAENQNEVKQNKPKRGFKI